MTVMTITAPSETEVHPFELAGYGPGPYVELGSFEDPSCGQVCDTCGKTGLRYKFKLRSASGLEFGVGSECIKKADPEMWLAIKAHYGVADVKRTAVERREAYDAARQLFNEYATLNPKSTYLQSYKCGKPFDEVKRVRTATFEKEAIRIQQRIDIERKVAANKAKRNQELMTLMKEVGAMYLALLRSQSVPAKMTLLDRKIAHTCCENSHPTAYIRNNAHILKHIHSFLSAS